MVTMTTEISTTYNKCYMWEKFISIIIYTINVCEYQIFSSCNEEKSIFNKSVENAVLENRATVSRSQHVERL